MNTNRTLATFAISAISGLALCQPAYRVIDLGAVNGASEAFAVNNNNQAVGWTYRFDGTWAAARWDNGVVTLLQTAGPTSAAYAISDTGRIVGKLGTKAVEFRGVNFYRQMATFGGGEGTALGLNNAGRACGSFQDVNSNWIAGGEIQSTIAIAGGYRLVKLGTLGGLWSAATDVNNNGQYVGWSHTAAGPTHACLLYENRMPLDLGTLGGRSSSGLSINDSGVTTGFADTAAMWNTPTYQGPVTHAFRRPANSPMADLGDPYTAGQVFRPDGSGYLSFPMNLLVGGVNQQENVYGVNSYGQGINKSGNVCGFAHLFMGPPLFEFNRAMVVIGGTAYDLNALAGNPVDWNLDFAWGINDNDTLVGSGFNFKTGTRRAFMAIRTR